MLRMKTVALALGLAVLATPATFGATGDPPPFVTGQPTSVTVVNPSTSPVPTAVVNPATAPALTSSVDEPARNPYEASGTSPSVCSPPVCEVDFPPIPAGHRLVIQHVSGFVGLTSKPQSVVVTLGVDPVPTGASQFIPASDAGSTAFDQAVLLYGDPGGRPIVSVNVGGAQFRTIMVATISGYLIDCSVNHCAPIAP